MEKDHFSSGDEAGEADSEGDAEPREDDNASAAEASVGTNAGWADAMARVLNKKIPESKPTILVRNKELEKEKVFKYLMSASQYTRSTISFHLIYTSPQIEFHFSDEKIEVEKS